MDLLLKSSILGKEFINYKKNTTELDRVRFRKRTRNGQIPIVIDSIDKDIGEILSCKETGICNGVFTRYRTYGIELIFEKDKQIKDVLKEIKILFLKKNREDLVNSINVGSEGGDIIDSEMKISDAYDKYMNKDDKILYLLLTKEKTMYEYIMSIIRYMKTELFKIFSAEK